MNGKRRPLLAVLLVTLLLTPGFAPGFSASLNLVAKSLTPVRTCAITGSPASTTAVADASVRQASPTSNFGSLTSNTIASTSIANRRLYVWFDLSVCNPAIPATAIVRLATLRLWMTGVAASCRTIDVFRVTASWTESGITWNNQPFGTTLNNPARALASDTFTIGRPAACQNRSAGRYLMEANPTSDVAAFVAGTATNRGWMLRDDVEASSIAYTETASAKNLGSLARAPQLIVTYVVVP